MERRTHSEEAHLDEGHHAGFIARAIAGIIDVLIIGTLGRWIGTSIFSPEDLRIVAVSGSIFWLYFSLLESSKLQGTVGKLFVRIKVVDTKGRRINFLRATLRNISKILSTVVLGIGFLMAIWTDENQALHDLIAKTYVVKR